MILLSWDLTTQSSRGDLNNTKERTVKVTQKRTLRKPPLRAQRGSDIADS